MNPTALQQFWFVVVAVLFLGFLVLEGFDFGVGMLMHPLGRGDDRRRRAVLNTIGPVWDGNEVWLITAGAPCSPRSHIGMRPSSPGSTSHCC